MSLDPQSFTKQFAVLCDWFNQKPNDLKTKMYFEFLSGLTPQELDQGIKEALRRERFFPTPQQIIDYARGSEMEQAEIAWNSIMVRLRKGTDTLTDPQSLTRKVFNMVTSPQSLGMATPAQQEAIKKDFIKFYLLELQGKIPALPGASQSTGGQNAIGY